MESVLHWVIHAMQSIHTQREICWIGGKTLPSERKHKSNKLVQQWIQWIFHSESSFEMWDLLLYCFHLIYFFVFFFRDVKKRDMYNEHQYILYSFAALMAIFFEVIRFFPSHFDLQRKKERKHDIVHYIW